MITSIGIIATVVTFFLHLFGVEMITTPIILACLALTGVGILLEIVLPLLGAGLYIHHENKKWR